MNKSYLLVKVFNLKKKWILEKKNNFRKKYGVIFGQSRIITRMIEFYPLFILF